MRHWLMKSEPDAWSWDQQVAKGVEPWSGVRNYQAANNMKSMRVGDRAFFYHSNIGKEIVGIIEIVKPYYPDPTDDAGRFGMVDVRAVKPLNKSVTLATIKLTPALANMALLKQSRLSVSPVTPEEWQEILRLSAI